MRRVEKVAEAQRLRAMGLRLGEIAERLGVARHTVSGYLTDPDLSKQRARRRRYSRPCPGCGRLMDGSRGAHDSPAMCRSCMLAQPHTLAKARRSRSAARTYSDTQILEALRQADARGIRTVAAWRQAGLKPTVETVVRRFDYWSRARELAGLRVVSHKTREFSRTTSEECARHVAAVWRQLGAPPAENAYRRAAGCDRPSSELIKVRCGTWVSALEMAAWLVGPEAEA